MRPARLAGKRASERARPLGGRWLAGGFRFIPASGLRESGSDAARPCGGQASGEASPPVGRAVVSVTLFQ